MKFELGMLMAQFGEILEMAGRNLRKFH